MPPEESKPVEPVVDETDAKLKGKQAEIESDDDDDNEPATTTATGEGAPAAASSSSKKKKSKRKKAKELLTGHKSSADHESEIKKAIGGLTPQQMKELLALNPSLRDELSQAAEMLKKMNLQDIMTGLAAAGKNVKDMGAYKFWQTQPVPRFGENEKIQTVDEVPKEPAPLIPGFEWVTVDLNSDEEIKEVYELLNGHYVEDDEAMFRFNYSPEILRWAMMSPGWKRKYHVGVRASQSRKLVAFISAIPCRLRVRENYIMCSEVNFLCIHKKLRGKRLAPVLIKEVTRISNTEGVWQGLYTAGIVLPRPVSTCRYFHRSINWQKLNDKPQYQIRKYALPDSTSTRGLRAMTPKDIPAVLALMKRYLKRFDMAPDFTEEEALHWFIPKPNVEQVIWSYVVEDSDKKITDFFSFFCVESSIINNPKHDVLRVAYLFYYASETGLAQPFDKAALKTRLNGLMHDALILAKKARFDVFNALTLMDNALFLEQQKFGGGDGQLHYYLFNYRMNPIAGGVDKRNQLDEENLSGIGLVMP
ncbi:hypothetical protein ACCO45_006593 [Purpureocillium lilacinum]|uniref:Uncharacterized protein n=1 Tax=Purpureocillium lilacinum TaxID=33203 RepID=A0ACC4DQA1_PURLI